MRIIDACGVVSGYASGRFSRLMKRSVIRNLNITRNLPCTSMQHAGISPLFSAQCSLNKLCAWRHNMPLPAVRCSPAAAIPYACGAKRALLPIAVGSMNINELMNINDIRESATIFPRPCKLTFDLLTLKVVSESGVTWATCVPILVFLRPLYSRVIPDVRDRQTDRQTSDSIIA